MGITDWQRALLEALTTLTTGQAETNRRLGNVEAAQIEGNMRLANVEAAQVEGNRRLASIEGRLDHALTTVVSGPVRELRERVERLERAVFPQGGD